MNKKRNGFTLSEVLLVLSVIGVVAALTIPALVQKVNDDQYKAAWKKTFSTMSQAHTLIMQENGGALANSFTTDSSFRNLFKAKLNYLTTCDDTSCAAPSLKKMDGSADAYSFTNNLVLSNGSILSIFHVDSQNCTHSSHIGSPVECGWIMTDVNGKTGPNQWGKDIYGIWVTNDRILPWGANPYGAANSSWNEPTCSTSSTGYGCGSKNLYN